MEIAQDHFQWQALVSVVLNIWILLPKSQLINRKQSFITVLGLKLGIMARA